MPSWAKRSLALLIAVGLIAIGWRVLFVLVTLHILVCFILIIVIMLQSGSAADLAGAFGGAGSQTAFGPRGADLSFARHHLVRRRVHDDVAHALREARPKRSLQRHRLGPGTNAEVRHSTHEAGAGSANSDSIAARATAGTDAGRSGTKAGYAEPTATTQVTDPLLTNRTLTVEVRQFGPAITRASPGIVHRMARTVRARRGSHGGFRGGRNSQRYRRLKRPHAC